jgi:hypothetical protein
VPKGTGKPSTIRKLLKLFTDNLPALLHSSAHISASIGVKDCTKKICGAVLDLEDCEEDEFLSYLAHSLTIHLKGYFPPVDVALFELKITKVTTVNCGTSLQLQQFDTLDKALIYLESLEMLLFMFGMKKEMSMVTAVTTFVNCTMLGRTART